MVLRVSWSCCCAAAVLALSACGESAPADPRTNPNEGPPQARVRPIRWERLLDLQGLQREDMLRQFMEKQQRIAREARS